MLQHRPNLSLIAILLVAGMAARPTFGADVVATTATPATPAPINKPPVPAPVVKPDPPALAPYLKYLRDWFATRDLDQNGYLDKVELAKAFRGPTAKPYDVAAENALLKKNVKPAAKPAATDDKVVSDSDTKSTATASTPAKSSPQPDYSKYPDYQFLKLLDKNDDDMISKEEFEQWAKTYAPDLKQLVEMQTKIAKAQQQMLAKLAAAERKSLEAQLKQQQAALHAMQRQHQHLAAMQHHH